MSPGIELEQALALANISCSALCCHSNETRAPIANPLNRAQLERTIYHSPSSIQVRGVVGQTHRQTDTQTTVTTIHFASSTTHISKRNKPRVKAIVSMSQMCRTIKQVVVGKMLTKYRYSKGKKTGNDDYWKSYLANSWSALAPLDSLVAAQEIKQLVQGTEPENTKFKKYTLHKW